MKILEVDDPDFYEWETHIFFDDCMEPDDTGYEFQVSYKISCYVLMHICNYIDSLYTNAFTVLQVNQFVRLLINTMDEQGKKWYGARNMKVPDPAKYTTPYGGRLVWTLPGSTQVVCHLKVMHINISLYVYVKLKLILFQSDKQKLLLSLRTKTKSATRRDGVNACTFIISWVINWKLGMTCHKLKKMQEQ